MGSSIYHIEWGEKGREAGKGEKETERERMEGGKLKKGNIHLFLTVTESDHLLQLHSFAEN